MRFNPYWVLLLPIPLWGQELLLTPQSCIVTEPETPCLLDVTLTVSQEINEPSCLYRSDAPPALFCVDRLDGQQLLSLTLQLNRAIELQLRSSDGRVIASQSIDYATYKPVTTRRRRGMGWNLL